MDINTIKSQILGGRYDKDFELLYSDVDQAKKRYIGAVCGFEKTFGQAEGIRLFTAPGRTEISGNHTDHQRGCVLAGSVNLDVVAVVAPNNDGVIRIKSEGYSMDVVNISDTKKKEQEEGRSIALVRGICSKFKELGSNISGFDAYTVSNVLKGSGLSSSAAFEILIGTIINTMFFENKADAITVAKIGQFAEREYFGKPCGLLDQMASVQGGLTYADFNNPENPIVEKISLDLSAFGYNLCVVDTGGNHSNLTQDYSDITIECKMISNELGVEYLRDADIETFFEKIANLRLKCGDRAVLRAFHFFNENSRVVSQKNALENGDFEAFLKQVNASGQSSYDYLQNLYSISNVKEQGLALAIALTKRFLGEKGACRVHGGGFAGTIQCYIPIEMSKDYKKMIEKVFGENSCLVLSVRSVGGYEIK